MMRGRTPVFLALLVGAAGCASALTDVRSLTAPGRHEVTLAGEGVRLGGILFRPEGPLGPRAGVVLLHGWGEPGLPGAPRVEGPARALADEGYVTLALSMRGWPPSEGTDDCGLRQPDDVVRAVAWLGTVPGVHPGRIAVQGYSQGGQVALLAAARSSLVRAVVAYYPVTDIARWAATTSLPSIREQYIPAVCTPGAPRSPLEAAGQIRVPVLLLHGDADTRVPTEQSQLLAAALAGGGTTVTLHLVAGAVHGFTASQSAEVWPLVLGFLQARLAAAP